MTTPATFDDRRPRAWILTRTPRRGVPGRLLPLNLVPPASKLKENSTRNLPWRLRRRGRHRCARCLV